MPRRPPDDTQQADLRNREKSRQNQPKQIEAKSSIQPQSQSLSKSDRPTKAISAQRLNQSSALVRKGGFNVWVGVCGVPGTGKTTYALALAELYSLSGYVIGHSAGTLPDTYPDGRVPNVHYHASVADASKALAKGIRGVHIIDADPSEVINFAGAIAQKSLDLNGGTHGVPVLLFLDEVVAADEMNPYRLDPRIKKMVALRRHLNIGFLFTTQAPQLCHYHMFSLATKVVFFRIIHKEAIKRFINIGIPEEIALRIPTLSRDRHEHIVWET
jgi:hypothetical protein